MREIQRWITTETDPDAITAFEERMAPVVDQFSQYTERHDFLADVAEQARLDFIVSGGHENRRQWMLPRWG